MICPYPFLQAPTLAGGIGLGLGTRGLGLRWACTFHCLIVPVGHPTRFPVEYGLSYHSIYNENMELHVPWVTAGFGLTTSVISAFGFTVTPKCIQQVFIEIV